MGQREGCRVSPWSDTPRPIPLLEVWTPPLPLFLPQQYQASFPLPTQCNCEMSIRRFIPSHPASLIPDPTDTPRSTPPRQRPYALHCPRGPRHTPLLLNLGPPARPVLRQRPQMTRLEVSLNPGSLPRPISDLLLPQGLTDALPTSYLYFIQPDKASRLVLEHHLMRFNSCCIPSQRSLHCCTLGPVQDLSKPVENSR